MQVRLTFATFDLHNMVLVTRARCSEKH